MHGRQDFDQRECERRNRTHGDFPSTLRGAAQTMTQAVSVPLTDRLASITKGAENLRGRLAEVAAKIGGDPFDNGIAELRPSGVGLHGQVDELENILIFLGNITDSLEARV